MQTLPQSDPSLPKHKILFFLIRIRKHIHFYYAYSDTNEQPETENGTVYSHDSGYENECCPASPITVPRSRLASASRPRTTRQRTTSTSQNTIRQNEAILRCNHRTIYTAGRPPWYNVMGQQKEPFVIGICGGSASGKTTVAQKIIESLDIPWVTLLSMDCFYKVNVEQCWKWNISFYHETKLKVKWFQCYF